MKTYRAQTRDRLLDYDLSLVPPRPHSGGLPFIYPWENSSNYLFAQQLYVIAKNSGYNGSFDTFYSSFGSLLTKQIIFGLFSTFPNIGDSEHLYYDLEDNILYYYDEEYIPINTLLIENTTLDAGDASDVLE